MKKLKEMDMMRNRLWLTMVRFRLFVKRLTKMFYDHLVDTPRDLRYCVVVTCRKCGNHAEAVEGYCDHVAFQCLHCGIITANVDIKMETFGEAEAHHHPAYELM